MHFSHRKYVSDYMRIAVSRVLEHFDGKLDGKRVLDAPAGIGWVGDELARAGAEAVYGDINNENRISLMLISRNHYHSMIALLMP